jgi:uncharacterized protein with HEPN domain
MSKAIYRLEKILECIENIDFIINNSNLKITQAIDDKIIKPAIRMNIIRIAEQFSKLKDDNEFKILENFKNEDLKGIIAVRNSTSKTTTSNSESKLFNKIFEYRNFL